MKDSDYEYVISVNHLKRFKLKCKNISDEEFSHIIDEIMDDIKRKCDYGGDEGI